MPLQPCDVGEAEEFEENNGMVSKAVLHIGMDASKSRENPFLFPLRRDMQALSGKNVVLSLGTP